MAVNIVYISTLIRTSHGPYIKVFTIYQIMLGWKTSKHYNHTDELPNPRPTQPQEKRVSSGVWTTFSPQQTFFPWVGVGVIWETDYRTPNPTQSSANTLLPATPSTIYRVVHSINRSTFLCEKYFCLTGLLHHCVNHCVNRCIP